MSFRTAVFLLGTIRTFSARTRAQAKARLEALTAGIAAAWGCTAAVGWTDGTPALCNDAGLAAAMERAAVSVFGKSGCVQIEPQMISEDFACYGSEVPICCALLGVGSPVGLHSAAFCPDSSVLLPAARFLAESAWSVLEDARA